MSKQTRTKIPADVGKIVNTVTGQVDKVDNVSRETGWYRVKTCETWMLEYYDSRYKKWGRNQIDMVSNDYWQEIDETPVNPVPADDVKEYITIQHLTFNSGPVENWSNVFSGFDDIDSAINQAHNLCDSETELRVNIQTVENRVIGI